MKSGIWKQLCGAFVGLICCVALGSAQAADDLLPSWKDGPSKSAITQFVSDVTTPGSKSFVPESERIAVFDNDGTLWSEQPIYVQFAFMLDQVKAGAPQHPEWKSDPVFQALTANDQKKLGELGEGPLIEFLLKASSGIDTDSYDRTVRNWLASSRHPKFKRPYTELVYQPMLELLTYLRSYHFKTFIVSGGSIEFMRPWSEQVYGIPPEQVVGTLGGTEFQIKDGQPLLMRTPKVDFNDDGPGKPVGIYRAIGRRPILAFGNSDGDQQMLEYTAAGSGKRLVGLVHHTDAAREYAYDRKSHIGTLDRALDEARSKGWVVVDMKDEWKQIFPSPK